VPFCEVEKGVRLYYETFGSGEPVVFVHGGGTSHEFWEQQMYDLVDDYQVVAYDLRGHGDSDKPPAGHNFDRFTEDLEALVNHLGLKRVTLVCHAIGGYVGMKFALRNPQALARLVLVSSGIRWLGSDEERGGFSLEFWKDYSEGLAIDKIEATGRVLDAVFFYKKPGEATRQEIIHTMMKWPLCATKQIAEAAKLINFEGQLHAVKAPVLIIHGMHDRKQRFSGAQYLCDSFPNASLIAFESSAHLPPLEEVKKFNELLRDFMGRRGQRFRHG